MDIFEAVRNGSIDGVRECIEDNGYSVDEEDRYGRTPLMIACEEGRLDIITLLIESGASIDWSDTYGNTALCYCRDTEVLSLLLDAGADIDVTNKCGDTVLHANTFDNKMEMISLLLEYDVDVNVRDDDGYTALMRACEHGLREIIELLIEAGADMNVRDYDGDTALHLISSSLIHLLLENGVDPNICNDQEYTPLMKFAERGDVGTVQLLLSYGARIDFDMHNISQEMINVLYSYPQSLYRKKDRSSTYLSGYYSDVNFVF